MGSLNAFLHPEQAGNKEVIVSERFKENGKPVPFVIRPITQQENDGLLRKYTKKDKKGNEYFDKVSYNQNWLRRRSWNLIWKIQNCREHMVL